MVLAAIASAGVAQPKGPWAGIIDLLTRGLLSLAVVGAVCRSGTERAWWLGFASFGWAYLGFPFRPFGFGARSLVDSVLVMLATVLGLPIEDRTRGNELSQAYFEIGHCLWGLLVAVIGGFLASALFGSGAPRPEANGAGVQPAGRRTWFLWSLLVAIALPGLALVTLIGAMCAPADPAICACITYLLTWWLTGLMALGAIVARGRRRQFWLGAAVIGAGFMLVVFACPIPIYNDPEMVLPTTKVMELARPSLEALIGRFSRDPQSIAAKNARIRRALKQPVPMHFPVATRFDDFLSYVRGATKDASGEVISIYVDPIGLQAAEKSLYSMVQPMDLEGVALGTTLGLCLKQLDLAFTVRDGMIEITSVESWEELHGHLYNDPFEVIFHCWLALIAAALGGMAAPVVFDLARGKASTAA